MGGGAYFPIEHYYLFDNAEACANEVLKKAAQAAAAGERLKELAQQEMEYASAPMKRKMTTSLKNLSSLPEDLKKIKKDVGKKVN